MLSGRAVLFFSSGAMSLFVELFSASNREVSILSQSREHPHRPCSKCAYRDCPHRNSTGLYCHLRLTNPGGAWLSKIVTRHFRRSLRPKLRLKCIRRSNEKVVSDNGDSVVVLGVDRCAKRQHAAARRQCPVQSTNQPATRRVAPATRCVAAERAGGGRPWCEEHRGLRHQCGRRLHHYRQLWKDLSARG